jgi:hypothetical protein
MKSAYNFLQSNAFGLCILFGTCPYMPGFLQKNVSGDVAALYTWILATSSVTIFGLCFWWLKADWVVEKPGYMSALGFGSLLGSLIGVTALFGMYGSNLGLWFYQIWRGLPADTLTALMILAVAKQLLSNKKVQKTSHR